MTNYVTGKTPIVNPKDWMKIAVGGVVGAIKLSDLKAYVGNSGGNGDGGTNPSTEWTVKYVEDVISSEDYYSKGFQIQSMQNGVYAVAEIVEIAGHKLSDFEINYPDINSTGTIISLIPLSLNTSKTTFETDVKVSRNGVVKTLTFSVRPDYVITPANGDASIQDLVNGKDFTFTVGGAPSDLPLVWEVEGIDQNLLNMSTSNNGNDLNISLKDADSITQTTEIKIRVKQSNGNVLKETTFTIVKKAQNYWDWSPNTATISKEDFASKGIETNARFEGSGIDVNLRTPDGYSYGDFQIEQNLNSAGLCRFTLVRQSVIRDKVVFVGTDDSGVSRDFTVTVTGLDGGNSTKQYFEFNNKEETTELSQSAEGTENSQKYQLQMPNIMPTEDGYNAGAFIFTSSDTTILSIDERRNVTTHKTGDVYIMVHGGDDPSVKGQYLLHVV